MKEESLLLLSDLQKLINQVVLIDYTIIILEGDPDVVGSFSMNRDENLTVVANRKNISDKEAFARLLLKMYKENSFHSIKFSTDHGYATSLDMTVYSWKEDIENGESIMQIEFRPIEYGKDYDLVHNPDKYVLFIDGTEIK